jgi:bacterioferritin (cytochrome b1)
MKNFTISGKPRHRRVFSEVLGIPIYGGLNKSYSYLLAHEYDRIERSFNQTSARACVHFILPEDWDAAMKYARESFAVEKTTENDEHSIEKMMVVLENPNTSQNERISTAKTLLDILSREIAELKKVVREKEVVINSTEKPTVSLINDYNKAKDMLKAVEKRVVDLRKSLTFLSGFLTTEKSKVLIKTKQ